MAKNNANNYSPVQYNTLTGDANNQINNVSPGSSGQVLTSNGASAQPTYQNLSGGGGGFQFYVEPSNAGNLTASTTYYLSTSVNINVISSITVAQTKFIMPISGTITICYGVAGVTGTLSSNQDSTLSLLVNGGSATTISNAIKFNTASSAFNNTSLSVAVSAGDYIQFRLVTGAFTTNPTNANLSVSVFIS